MEGLPRFSYQPDKTVRQLRRFRPEESLARRIERLFLRRTASPSGTR